jgi:selenocysteine-specific elongation factor
VGKNIDEVKKRLLDLYNKARFSPPMIDELPQKLELSNSELRSIINLVTKEKNLVQINTTLYLHNMHWEDLINFLINYFSKEEEMPVAALKNYIDTTRKYAIPIFEFLDSEGYTTRAGDVRKKGHKI